MYLSLKGNELVSIRSECKDLKIEHDKAEKRARLHATVTKVGVLRVLDTASRVLDTASNAHKPTSDQMVNAEIEYFNAAKDFMGLPDAEYIDEFWAHLAEII